MSITARDCSMKVDNLNRVVKDREWLVNRKVL